MRESPRTEVHIDMPTKIEKNFLKEEISFTLGHAATTVSVIISIFPINRFSDAVSVCTGIWCENFPSMNERNMESKLCNWN